MKLASHRSVLAALVLLGCSSSSSGGAGDASAPVDGGLGDTSSSVDGSPITQRDAEDKEEGGSCTGSDGISFGTEVCNRCMDAHCCTSVDACFRSSDCSDLSDCLDTCVGDAGGATCRSDCRSKHAGSTVSYDAVAACRTSGCATECP